MALTQDSHYMDLLEEKRILAGKEGPLSDEEGRRLEQINLELKRYNPQQAEVDQAFAEYLKERYGIDLMTNDGQPKAQLTPEEGREKAKRLVRKALRSDEVDNKPGYSAEKTENGDSVVD